MTFHHTFLNILNDIDILTKPLDFDFDFDFDFDILPKTFNTIQKISPFLINKIKKEQQLIETNDDYYIARDITDNTIYICYKNLLMIDIDNEIDIQKYLHNNESTKNMSFDIYKTKNGYHVFCISHQFNYKTQKAIEFMINNLSDFYYTCFTFIRGWCVRLNKKFTETDDKIYKHVCIIDNNNIDKKLLELSQLHFKLINKYTHTLNLN